MRECMPPGRGAKPSPPRRAPLQFDTVAGWESTTNKPQLMRQIAQTIQKQSVRPPIAIDGPGAMPAVCCEQSEQGRRIACLANTWGWFRSTRIPNPRLNEGVSPPPACKNVTVTFSRRFGKPRRVVEAVTGTELPALDTAGGWRVSVPAFQTGACVVAAY